MLGERKKGGEMVPRICGKNDRIRRDNAESNAEGLAPQQKHHDIGSHQHNSSESRIPTGQTKLLFQLQSCRVSSPLRVSCLT